MKGKVNLAAALVIVLIAGVGVYFASNSGMLNLGSIAQGSAAAQQEQAVASLSTCPTDGDTSLTLSLYNDENSTSESFDANVSLYGSDGSYQTGSDTTAGTYTINCGETQTVKIRSANGAVHAGDNSWLRSVAIGSAPNARIDNGNAVFTPTKSNVALNLRGESHDVLQFRLFNKDANGYVYNTSGDTAGAWTNDAANFTSTTSNQTTYTSVGSGGEYNFRLDFKAASDGGDFSDRGYWIMVDAASTVWDTPTCSLDGSRLTDAKGQMTTFEARANSAYEYAYKIPAGTSVADTPYHSLDCTFKALSGQDPTQANNIAIDFAAIGQYLSTDGVSLSVGANDDSSSTTTIFTVQDTDIMVQ